MYKILKNKYKRIPSWALRETNPYKFNKLMRLNLY